MVRNVDDTPNAAAPGDQSYDQEMVYFNFML